MFKEFRRKWKVGLLVLIFVFSFFTPLMPVHQAVYAQGSTTTNQLTSIPAKQKEIKESIFTKVTKMLKTTVFSALLNVVTLTTQRLAYDAAMYVSGGGQGGTSLIEPRGFKEYAQMLGEQAVGEFIGTLSQSWSKMGINLCEPSPLQKLDFQKSFTQNITVSNYQVKSQAPAAAKCDWNTIKKSYTALGESLADFSIDVDLKFDVNLQAGGTVNWDTNSLTGALNDISTKFSSVTESLYNSNGIDLSKLWADAKYLQKLLDDSGVPSDWKDVSDVKKQIKVLRESMYGIVNDKMKALETQAKTDTQSNMYKLLYEGELSFWWDIKNKVDLGSDKDAAYKEAFTNATRLQVLLKNKLVDRTAIMRLFSENKITNSVLKYIYLDDLKTYAKKQGDDLSSFTTFLQPGKNPASVALSLEQELAKKSAELSNKATELANNQGFKNVTNIVSGRIKTPATVVQDQFKQQQIKDPSQAKWSAITGAYFNADVGTALLNVALSTFTSTVFNNLMSKVYTGLFKPDQMINQNKVTVGLSQTELRKRYASSIESEVLSLDYELSNYNLLDEFIICPEKYETTNNCVIDADWAQLLQGGGENMTIQEALDAGYLNADWALISQNNTLNGDKYCYQKAYCYDNLQKLRRARILPVGFELAADLCEDPANSAYCSIQEPISLGEVVSNFYNCGQDDEHPYSLWCNLIDPTWLLKAPAMKCRVQGYSEDVVSEELPQRSEVCVDDVSCIAEDDSGDCLGWGYCTKEKNVWRFSMANECSAVEDSCRSFTDSTGSEYSFLKNTLWITDFNTCDSTNVGCAWYSRNKAYDLVTGAWQWTDNKNTAGEATDRTYFNNKVAACDASEEGCSRLVRAIPRLGTNLIPNSSFTQYTKYSDTLYSFDNWETTSGANLRLYNDQVLLDLTSASAYKGLHMTEPIYIVPKDEPRYFIYSAKILIPSYLLDKALDTYYNLENQWSLTVDAYKVAGTSASSSYVYDLLGKAATNQDELEELYFYEDMGNLLEVDLYLKFTTVADIDRLNLGLLALSGITNTEGNQVIIQHLQLEEVGQYELSPSDYNEYNTSNLVYVKKAPNYYNCYQSWYSYTSASQCDSANGIWNEASGNCEAPAVCAKFAPYCAIDEVGCEMFTNLIDGERFSGVVAPDDYCPEICAGYGRYYESISRFSDGQYLNFIPSTASSCSYDAVGCEEYTSVADDSGIEQKEYFAYNRTCELEDSPDCQLFYTWDNPDVTGAKEISRYFLKALNNEPVLSRDDSLLCNEDIYNAGTNPNCYKFYAVAGGENIDLSAGDSEYITYHLIDYTVSCSANCKPYRLTRQVTEEQCLDGVTDLNQFKATGTKTLADGSEVAIGTCTVYVALNENASCSAAYNGCREYRGSQSNSYFTLLSDSFEMGLDDTLWNGGIIVEEAVSYEGHSLNNLNSSGGTVIAKPESYLSEDSLYLLSFWARTAVSSDETLNVSLSSADEYFTGANSIALTANWQKYTLGPIMALSDESNPELIFTGIASGNLYIDSVELREIADSYYYIADSWSTPGVCDQLPGTNLSVPGYMLGCQGYQDSNDYVHYLKSFSSSCRESAVGCELVIDTQNNPETRSFEYNDKVAKSIGDLVLPLISTETSCILGGYNWDNGRCYQDFDDAPISQNQCELWGYYWLEEDGVEKCFSESLSDNVAVASDTMIPLVINNNYLCTANKVGCSAFGQPSLDENGEVMECNYGELCTVSKGCTCRIGDSSDYVCTVEFGQESCTMDTVYLLDDPLQYDNILCEANAAACDEFVDSDNGIWYFRNPGNRLCEFKELRIDGQLKRGWFKKGTNEACYDSYKPSFGLWGFDHNLDYYVAGIDDLANYNFYAATCASEADRCTNFIDPTAMSNSGNRNYYYLWDDNVDSSSCNGQVNLAEGCVLFNNTAKPDLVYSAETSYANNLARDYKPVSPYMGVDNKLLNPLTSYNNPYYVGDNVLENEVSVGGYIPLIDQYGAIQYLEYGFDGLIQEPEESSGGAFSMPGIGGILGDLEGVGATGVIGGIGNISGTQMGFEVPNLGIETMDDFTFNIDDIRGIYFDILENNAQTMTQSTNYNNSNMVVKVQRDRTCAEWLDSGDSQVVENASGQTLEVNTSLIACNQYSNSAARTQCVQPIVGPPQKLDLYNYTLRGFGWDVLDYSGYSVPNMYALDDYEQLYLEESGETVLAVDMQLACERRTDCSANNPDNYRCVNKRCYNIYNGKTSDLANDDDLLDVSCRAYPREDSPLAYEFGKGNNLTDSGGSTCYPFTGKCVNILGGLSSDQTCSTNLDCNGLEACVFNQMDNNDDCLCDYQKLSYEESAVTVYLGIDDDAAERGTCLGGVNSGLFCESDLDCQTSNRTDFRVEKSGSSSDTLSRCVYPNKVNRFTGLKGLCLEKSSNGNCITWYPVDRFIGQSDIYDRDEETAFSSEKKYYCLATTTNIPLLRQGSNQVMAVPLCPENRFGVDSNEYIQAEDVATGRMYYLVDKLKGGVACDSDQNEYRKNLLYTGALVNVTEDKINHILQDWPDGNLDGKSGDHCIWGDDTKFEATRSKIKTIYEQIRENWQGKSCLYMLTDMALIYPEYFNQEPNYWDSPNYWPNEADAAGDARDESVEKYPIVLVCRPDDMTDFTDSSDEKIKITGGANASMNYYGIDPYLHYAYGYSPKSLSMVLEEIKVIYAQHDNNCDIAFMTTGRNAKRGDCSDMSDAAKEAEAFARELYYIVNNVCEYQNITLDNYQNLYDTIMKKRSDDSTKTFTERKAWVEPKGEQKVCSVLAQVIDDDGEYRAYTNRLSDYGSYREDLKAYGDVDASTKPNPEKITLTYVSTLPKTTLSDPPTWNELDQVVLETEKAVDNAMALLKSEKCPVDNLVDNTVWLKKSGKLEDGASYVSKYINTWAKVSVAKFYELNPNLTPSPFGAVVSNNLYEPYLVPSEAIPYFKQHNYQYTGLNNITLEESDDSIDDVPQTYDDEFSNDYIDFTGEDNRITVKLLCEPSSSGLYEKNQLFDLYENVYSLKSYKPDRIISDQGKLMSSIFALYPNSKYSDVTWDLRDPIYQFSSPHMVLRASDLCKINVNDIADETDDSCDLITTVFPVITDDLDSDVCIYNPALVMGEVVYQEAYCSLPSDVLNNVNSYIASQNTITLTLSDALNVLENKYALHSVSIDGKDLYEGIALKDGSTYDQKSELNLSDDNAGSIVMKNLNNVERYQIDYAGVSIVKSFYKETISDNSLYELSFYAQANKDAMPISNIVIDWGDGGNNSYIDYKFKNHLPVCNTSGSSMKYENGDFIENIESVDVYAALLNLEEMNKTASVGAQQGIAADPDNCTEEPFVFKHWFTNVKGYNANGDPMCNKGIPLDAEGNISTSPDGEDVVKCMLQGSISITNNFGYTVIHPVYLYVSLRYQLFTSFYAPTMTVVGWEPAEFVPVEYGSGFSFYSPPVFGGVEPIRKPFVLNP